MTVFMVQLKELLAKKIINLKQMSVFWRKIIYVWQRSGETGLLDCYKELLFY